MTVQSAGFDTGTRQKLEGAVISVLAAVSISHFLNDTMQSLLPAIYPLFKSAYHLNFMQIGFITFAFQLTASLLQPFVGRFTDRHPVPYSLSVSMALTLLGLVLLSVAANFLTIIAAAALVGVGSSVFHPESSRVARLASGGRHGFAQSVFQVGGNVGQSAGPLLAAFIVAPRGQGSIAWFSLMALAAMVILFGVGRWYAQNGGKPGTHARPHVTALATSTGLSPRRTRWALTVLIILMFSKFFYLSSLNAYYIFYLIAKFRISVEAGQIDLFVFLFAVAAGTLIGGPIGDRIGRKAVIWFSILGVLPFSLVLPHANLFWTVVLTIPIGLILASAFPAILVYATELMPHRVGMIAGLFFGFAFGLSGLGAAILGEVADLSSITFVYHVCAWLPGLGLLAAFLPNLERPTSLPRPELPPKAATA